ncbi:MAG: hypothetical protein ABSC63_10625 [Candidatus Binataceae bacterium]|jgi:hypothetical protein
MEFGLLLLAQAMLEQAIADWRVGFGRPEWSPRGRLSAEAADWLFSDERRATFTFKDAADVLGAEVNWLRAMIRAEHGGAG